jgi:flavin reductase (DIM6/NTAB) family NADH-FMN oxidoreductase RutF
MKKDISLSKAKWLMEPGCVVLVSTADERKANVMTFSWQTPIHSNKPCLALLVIRHERYSYELLQRNMELVVNIPGEELIEQVHFAGTVSGRKIDKFKEAGLTPVPAKLVHPPHIEECAGHLECRVNTAYSMETHDLLICEVLRAVADPELFDGKWITGKFHTLHYLGGRSYGLMTGTVDAKKG